jgi:hypothetical protein
MFKKAELLVADIWKSLRSGQPIFLGVRVISSPSGGSPLQILGVNPDVIQSAPKFGGVFYPL